MDSQESHLAPAYDLLVDWDRRLAREAPFFEGLFKAANVVEVLDLGCGSGRHAARFASWGLEVTGIDPDPAMLELTRSHARETGVDLQLVEAGFADLVDKVDGPFDAIVCLGNTLPMVGDREALGHLLGDAAYLLNPGGILILHLQNYPGLRDRNQRFLPPVLRETDQGSFCFIKLLTWQEEKVRFEFLNLTRGETGWRLLDSSSSCHLVISREMLADLLGGAGFDRVEYYGDHKQTPYDQENSPDLIVVAHCS